MLGGEFKQRVTALEIELLRDIRAVIINGARVNAENIGNLLAGFVICDQFEDASFGRGQALERGKSLV